MIRSLLRRFTVGAVISTAVALSLAWASEPAETEKRDGNPPTGTSEAAPADPAAAAPAQEGKQEGEPAADAKPADLNLTVAILDFAADTAGSPELGAQVSEILAASLSGTDGVTLVDRSSLARALQEQELNLSGVVNADDAAKVGKLVGARLLVTGKAFVVGKKMFLTAKVIGTETSLVDPVLVTGDREADVGELAIALAEKLATRLRESGPRLVGDDRPVLADPLPDLRRRLATRKLPVVAVTITEGHVTSNPARGVDPAVQTEVRILLKEAGIRVIEGDDAARAEGGVTIVINGEAMSEFAARIGNLISCSARAEITLKDRKSGEVLFTHRETTRAVDLSEQIAGKTALERAGRVVGLRILEHLAETLPARDAAADAAAPKPDAPPAGQ